MAAEPLGVTVRAALLESLNVVEPFAPDMCSRSDTLLKYGSETHDDSVVLLHVLVAVQR
jgi:hypothetical protein